MVDGKLVGTKLGSSEPFWESTNSPQPAASAQVDNCDILISQDCNFYWRAIGSITPLTYNLNPLMYYPATTPEPPGYSFPQGDYTFSVNFNTRASGCPESMHAAVCQKVQTEGGPATYYSLGMVGTGVNIPYIRL